MDEEIKLVTIQVNSDYRTLNINLEKDKRDNQEQIKKIIPQLKKVKNFLKEKSTTYFFTQSKTNQKERYKLKGNHQKFILIDLKTNQQYKYQFKIGQLQVNGNISDQTMLKEFSNILKKIMKKIEQKQVEIRVHTKNL